MWVWDRSIGLWLWGVFQPNQEIKCLFAQLDRPTTNQSNVVCDYSSGGSLACFCVYWTKKCRMSPDVSQVRALCVPRAPCVPRVSREPRERPGPGAPLAAREPPLAARPGSSARGICPASYEARPDNLIGLIICSSSYKARPDNLIGLVGFHTRHNFFLNGAMPDRTARANNVVGGAKFVWHPGYQSMALVKVAPTHNRFWMTGRGIGSQCSPLVDFFTFRAENYPILYFHVLAFILAHTY